MATYKKRKSAWIGNVIWAQAKQRAEDEGVDLMQELRDLVTYYADGVFDIDPREVPDTDPTRMSRPIHPVPADWERAAERAQREHGITVSALSECIAQRYARGHIRIKRTKEFIEVQGLRRDLTKPPKDQSTPDKKAPKAKSAV